MWLHPMLLQQLRERAADYFVENKALKLFTETPLVNRSGENAPKRTDFGLITGPAVNSPSATTLENNEKFRPSE